MSTAISVNYSDQRIRGTILVALSGVLFGLMGFLGTKIIAQHLSIENMLFWRFSVATICLILFRITSQKTDVIYPFKKSYLKIFILSAISYSASSGFYFLSSHYIGTGLAMVIFYCFPIFVVLFAWTFGSWQANAFAISALFAVVVGIFLLKGESVHAVNLTGIFLGMIAALSFATYVFGIKNTTKKIDASVLALLVCIGNSCIFLVLALYTHSFYVPTSLSAWIFILAIAILSTALPIQLLLNGLKYINPVNASILSALEPVITLLIGVEFLHEAVSHLQILGVIIVLIGAVLIQFEKVKNQPQMV